MTTQLYTVQLTHDEWQRVVSFLSLGPWRDVNPLLLSMSEQLQKQIALIKQSNSGEVPDYQGETGVKQ
jgi:hypothetical protein